MIHNPAARSRCGYFLINIVVTFACYTVSAASEVLLLIWEGQSPHGCQAHWGRTQRSRDVSFSPCHGMPASRPFKIGNLQTYPVGSRAMCMRNKLSQHWLVSRSLEYVRH